MRGRYDVIIVGLGPAGAAAAVTLARAGAKVLALDARPGHAKPCGGCLSARAMASLAFLDPPAWLTTRPVATMYLEAGGRPSRRFTTQTAGAYFVERARLDAWLAQRAGESGAEVVHERARGLEPQAGGWAVRTSQGAWQGGWLLGADGATSLVGRALDLGRTTFAYKAIVEERPLPPGLAERLEGAALLDLGGAPGGYAWAFGRQGVLNLGLAGRGSRTGSTTNLVGRYGAFLARLGLGRPGAWRGALIPCPDGRPARLARGRAAVIGDAAAAADPFLGEGIGQAVHSGLLAGRAILEGGLDLYQARMRAGLLREHRHARLLARLIYRAPALFQSLAQRHPGATELAWQVLRGQRAYAGIWAGVTRLLLGLSAGPPPQASLDR
ncbi:MAG: FAD-dependent monooxygenase [Desulfarculus sp.]|nr:FAD-dependent monooxygenase [Desulfarculus sp.]